MDLEVRQLRYFVALAEELHFGRAAERLGIAQPPLTRAIQGLEAQLGVPLLERTTRRVALTLAGEELLRHGRRALESVAAAGRRAQRAGGPVAELRVAVKPSGDTSALQAVISEYHDANPELPRAEVIVCGYGEPAARLRDGRADVGLLRLPIDSAGLDCEPLVTEARVAILAAGHRLARAACLRRADLEEEPVPRWPTLDPAAVAYWAGRDGADDMAEAVPGPAVTDLAQLLEVVALGQAVAFLPASAARRAARPEIVAVPVTDLSGSTVVVAWPDDCRSLAVAAFVRAACALATRTPEAAASLA